LDGPLKFGNSVGHQLFGFREVVGIVQRVVFEPAQAVDLEIPSLDLADMKAPPAV
jgi:hypothetical protein